MINNITNVDTHLPQMSIVKASQSVKVGVTPPILGFKSPPSKQKALIRVKKVTRSDNMVVYGEIEDEYVDIVETDDEKLLTQTSFNFFQLNPQKKKTKILKNCYMIDYIQSPKVCCGMGTEAIKQLAEKAMFDSRAQGRIVTYSCPVWQDASPARFFYKIGFRFMDPDANEYIEECISKKTPDIPAQIGMMYLPKANLHKLLRYGELF